MRKMPTAYVKPNKLWSKDYIFLMIANFFLFFSGCLLLPVLPVYLKQDGVTDFQIGTVAAVFYVTSMLMRTFASRLSARVGKKLLLLLAMFVFTFSMIGYYLFAGLAMITQRLRVPFQMKEWEKHGFLGIGPMPGCGSCFTNKLQMGVSCGCVSSFGVDTFN